MIKVADPNVWMYEHRFLMEQKLGRKLARKELVHHNNGDSLANSFPNLQKTSIATHNKIHFTISTWAKKFNECRRCHSTQYPHMCHGLCSHCYAYLKWHRELAQWL